MAILWERQIKGREYKVCSAGKSLRLYTDGVFHTQYNPDHLISGGIWDLLVLPALMLPEGEGDGGKLRVLVLGVGGAAVVHLLKALLEPELIKGVELNPVHIRLMKRFFYVKGKGIEIVQGDAIEFVKNFNRGKKKKDKPFDVVIDDLFYEENCEPHRAVAMDKKWMTALRRCMSRKGVLISNFVDRKQFNQARDCGVQWNSVFSLSLPAYENCVGAFFRREDLMMDIEGRLARAAYYDKRLSLKRLRYNIRQEKS